MLLVIFIIFSHPFLFAFFRGNLDILVGILLLNILNYKKNNSFTPGFLIGIAGAIKLVPLAFCIYLIAVKNYRSIISCFITFAALTLFSINYYDLTLVSFINYFLNEYNEYKNIYVLGESAMSFFSDPWLLILGFLKFMDFPEILFEGYYKYYNILQIIWMTLLTICMLVSRKNLNPLFVMLLIGIMVVGFPAPSNDYKVLYLLPGVILYLSSLDKDYSSAIHILGISSTLLFLHFSFFFVIGPISISSIIRPFFYLIPIFAITMIFAKNFLKQSRILNL
jgi:alpha-1,2-mannosyltransferase